MIKVREDKYGNQVYSIKDVRLSSLIRKILEDKERGGLPLLGCRFLFHFLSLVPFENQDEVFETIKLLTYSVDHRIYFDSDKWEKVKFYQKLKYVYSKIKNDYFIKGLLLFYPILLLNTMLLLLLH